MRALAFTIAFLAASPVAAQSEVPTEEQAVAAFQYAYANRPMRVGNDEEPPAAQLGECGDNPHSVGIACQMFVSFAGGPPLTYLIGFAKGPEGWIATIYGGV